MGVATVAANRIALVVTKMITHLHVQYPLGQLAEQTVRANELDALLAGLRHQLLDHTLLINASRRRHLLLDLLPRRRSCQSWSDSFSDFRPASSTVEPTVSRRGDGAGGLE